MQVQHLTRDTNWESKKKRGNKRALTQAGDHKAAWNRQGSIIKTNVKHKKDPQKKLPPETVSKETLEGLNV